MLGTGSPLFVTLNHLNSIDPVTTLKKGGSSSKEGLRIPIMSGSVFPLKSFVTDDDHDSGVSLVVVLVGVWSVTWSTERGVNLGIY